MSGTEIGFIIEQYDEINGLVIFKPYSKEFKKDMSEYRAYSVNVENFSIDLPIEEQLAKISKPIVDDIIKKETNDYTFVKAFAKENLNKTVTYLLTSIPPVSSLSAIETTSIETTSTLSPTADYIFYPPQDSINTLYPTSTFEIIN